DPLDLSLEIEPDLLIVLTGDAAFANLAIKWRRHGIRVEVASVAANLGNTLRSAANDVIDLAPLLRTFEINVQDSASRPRAQPQRRRRPRFRPLAPGNG